MIEIVYPCEMKASDSRIESWFVSAVRENQIPPDMLSAKSPLDMAKALDYIGWIVTKDRTL